MYIVYILKSIKSRRHYIGQTKNIKERANKHNLGLVRSTKHYKPWKVIYTESYKTRSAAVKREAEIKSYKGGIKFKKLLGLWK